MHANSFKYCQYKFAHASAGWISNHYTAVVTLSRLIILHLACVNLICRGDHWFNFVFFNLFYFYYSFTFFLVYLTIFIFSLVPVVALEEFTDYFKVYTNWYYKYRKIDIIERNYKKAILTLVCMSFFFLYFFRKRTIFHDKHKFERYFCLTYGIEQLSLCLSSIRKYKTLIHVNP